jgi:hypothetical protein
MLTFFRRIRKGLIEGGATSKYLLYAIGEIALVVIGILIALQINNWNEDRKKNLRLISHYQELRDELNYDLERWQDLISELNAIDSMGIYMRSFLDDQIESVDSVKLRRSFLSAGFYATFSISSVAYNNLVRSGDVHLIENKELKRKLGNIHAKEGWGQSALYGIVNQSIEDYHNYRHRFTDPMMTRTFFNNQIASISDSLNFKILDKTLNDFSIDWNKVIRDQEYSIKLDRLSEGRLTQKMHYYLFRDEIVEILDLLNEELNSSAQ